MMRPGFTLMEAMIALVILAVLVSLSMPSIQTGLRQASLDSATQEVMHLVDFARVQAQSRNRAYELEVDFANQTIAINEGTSTRCSGLVGDGVDPDPIPDIRTMAFGVASTDLDNIDITVLRPAEFSNDARLCFLPDGRTMLTATSAPVPAGGGSSWGAGEADIEIRRTGSSPSVPHVIVVPYNGIPRREP